MQATQATHASCITPFPHLPSCTPSIVRPFFAYVLERRLIRVCIEIHQDGLCVYVYVCVRACVCVCMYLCVAVTVANGFLLCVTGQVTVVTARAHSQVPLVLRQAETETAHPVAAARAAANTSAGAPCVCVWSGTHLSHTNCTASVHVRTGSAIA